MCSISSLTESNITGTQDIARLEKDMEGLYPGVERALEVMHSLQPSAAWDGFILDFFTVS